MGDPVRCLPKVVHPDVAALKLQHNVQDALIAETSIKEGHLLVTDDTDLAAVTKEYGAQCLSVSEFLLQYT